MSYTLIKTFSFPSSYGTAFKARLYDSAGTQSGSDITGLTANSNGILLVNITVPSQSFYGSYRVWRNSLAFTDPYDDAISINVYNAPIIGGGPYQFVLTVEDQDSNSLSGATVRLTSQSEYYQLTTPVSGIITFNLSADTYALTIFKANYDSYNASFGPLSGNSSLTASLTEIDSSIIPGPAEVAGILTAYDEDNDEVEGVVFQFQLLKTDCDPTDGQSYPRDIFEATSQSYTGLVEVALLENATYRGRRVTNAASEQYGPWKEFKVTSNPFIIPQLLGYQENG